MRNARVWRALLGVEKTVVERVEFDEDAPVLVARVRPVRGDAWPVRGVPTPLRPL